MKLQFIAIVVAALCTAAAQASTLQITDAQRLHSLRIKLHTLNEDVTQVMEQSAEIKDHYASDCLYSIHDQGQSVSDTAAGVGDLIALSILMKDNVDELLVLRALRTWLIVLTDELPHARQIINGTMSLCSNSAVVNAKGQALLTALSEWNEPVASLSKRVNQVVPPKR